MRLEMTIVIVVCVCGIIILIKFKMKTQMIDRGVCNSRCQCEAKNK